METDTIVVSIPSTNSSQSPQPNEVPVTLIPLLVIMKELNSSDSADLPVLVTGNGDAILNHTTDFGSESEEDIIVSSVIKEGVPVLNDDVKTLVVVLRLDSRDNKETIAVVSLRGDKLNISSILILEIWNTSSNFTEGAFDLSVNSTTDDTGTVFTIGGGDIEPLGK